MPFMVGATSLISVESSFSSLICAGGYLSRNLWLNRFLPPSVTSKAVYLSSLVGTRRFIPELLNLSLSEFRGGGIIYRNWGLYYDRNGDRPVEFRYRVLGSLGPFFVALWANGHLRHARKRWEGELRVRKFWDLSRRSSIVLSPFSFPSALILRHLSLFRRSFSFAVFAKREFLFFPRNVNRIHSIRPMDSFIRSFVNLSDSACLVI